MSLTGDDRRDLFEKLRLYQEDIPAKPEANYLVCITTFLEILILASLIVLELLIRLTTIFPFRRQPFSCLDETINRQTTKSEYIGFALESDVPDVIVFSLSFCIPAFIILVGEIGLWAFAEDRQRSIRVLCASCRIPQVTRRLVRFIGVFIFGACSLMIFVDVTKHLTGRLRPNFLEICKVNATACKQYGYLGDDSMCTERDEMKLRHARTSFPSMDAALSSYSAMFISTYVHGALRSRSVKVLRPFLTVTFCMLSLLCGLIKIGIGTSHWADVLAGFLGGAFIALYLARYVLRGFNEYVAERQVLSMLHQFLLEHKILVQLTKEVNPFPLLPLQIPRPQMDTRART